VTEEFVSAVDEVNYRTPRQDKPTASREAKLLGGFELWECSESLIVATSFIVDL
jgi:hypothetical protein